MTEILKYPRTHHLQGSRLQPGDEDLEAISFAEIAGRYLVVEEKLDGANSGISFGPNQKLLLQSRGHYLTGGEREKHFALFKSWANGHTRALWQMLGTRYVMYGEWLYAKHTVYYDNLPHYFMEFDVFDREQNAFLSTARRNDLLDRAIITAVPVLEEGQDLDREKAHGLINESLYKSSTWRDRLFEAARAQSLDVDRVDRETDHLDLAEGLYIKVEEDEIVKARYKFIRPSFLTAVTNSEGHWLDRPILPNTLADGVDIFAPPAPDPRH